MSAPRPLRSSQGRSFSANRTRVNTANRNFNNENAYPEIKQRGFYSDIVTEEANEKGVEQFLAGPETAQDTLWAVSREKHTPLVNSFQVSGEKVHEQLNNQFYGATTEDLTISDFDQDSYKPKVQLPFFTKPGELPRKIEIERRLRLYKSLELEELLADRNIKSELLMPKQQPEVMVMLNRDDDDPAPFPSYLPLHIFDNDEHDCRTATEWINMGNDNGNRKPVPGIALLPTEENDRLKDPTDPRIEYKWFDVGVLDFDPASKLYFVQTVDRHGRVVGPDGNTVIDGGVLENGERAGVPGQWWIPRIRLMYKAEDPRVFADRVGDAFQSRKICEAELRYNLYIDCMPMDGVGELDQASLKRMIDWAQSAPGIDSNKK